jgi:Protein of unknown function (DUF2865)
MRHARTLALTLAGVMAAVGAVAAPQQATAGGLFGDIFHFFGGSRDERFTPATAYTDPRAPVETSPDLQAPPSMLGGGATYCVRLCDGRYFPLSPPAAASRAGAARICSALCPAAQTAIFRGGDIDHASGTRGERYADLANAFVYRDHLVANCTCNGRDAFGLAHVDIANDPTLRAGDLVATRSGLEIFRGSVGDAHRNAEFTPIRRENVSAELRRTLAATQMSRGQ